MAEDMGGCQNYAPFLGTLNIRCRTTLGTPKGTIVLTTTHMKDKGFRVHGFIRSKDPGIGLEVYRFNSQLKV